MYNKKIIITKREQEVDPITFPENLMRKIEEKNYILKNTKLQKYYIHIYHLRVKKCRVMER